MQRLRLTFEKTGALRYTSHLDLQKVWVRALLRAKAPLAYTLGFHPTPKVGYAWPLPLGWGSSGELIDIWLDTPEDQPIDMDSFAAAVNRGMPLGLRILQVEELPYSAPALTNEIQSAEYRVTMPKGTSEEELREKLTRLLAQDTIERERRGKVIDMKPLIEDWRCETDSAGNVCLWLRMTARNAAMGRPDELLDTLGYDAISAGYERIKYLF